MKKQYIVLICGVFTLAGADGNVLYFATEDDAHNAMWANYPQIYDYVVQQSTNNFAITK